jgi:hypothetical protein
MYIYVYIYIYIYIYMHIYIYIYIYINIYIYAYICIHLHIHSYLYGCIHLFICIFQNQETRWNISFTVDMYGDSISSKCTQTECYNVLFLTSRGFFVDFMDRFLDFRYNATKRNPNSGTVVLWVVDRMWFGYNTNLTIAENIKGRFGDIGFFQIVHVENAHGEKINDQIREITQLSATTAVTIHRHESHDQASPGVRHQFNSINASIVYFAYANDAIYYSAGN